MKTIILLCILIVVLIFDFCTSKDRLKSQLRDYQIECTMDSMYLYDNQKLIGTIPYDSSKFSLLIYKDNQ